MKWTVAKERELVQKFVMNIFILLLYAFLYSMALNIFLQNGNIYAGGITGISQIITTLITQHTTGHVSLGLVYWSLNVPLLILGWFLINRKFLFYTITGVTFVSIAIELTPKVILISDPIICAIFGGAISGFSLGLALKHGLSTGGLDIILLSIRQLTGRSIGNISLIINGTIVIISGYIFGWPHMFYSILSILVASKTTDIIYTKYQKVQVMIITPYPDEIVKKIQEKLTRGITIIYHAQGAYTKQERGIIIMVMTQFEMDTLRGILEKSELEAFISISQNIEILSDFQEDLI
ncbi:YitT family protein [Vagococcus intermedius]|uniref:YitT family protein n=1 Tax=Vagococcus intermedius TaxID=2991418 RepID=A0AAF0CTH8_9ENTE|nr:YitT family protein [Vagococcus intermedius]WEG72552.1 YitT family protein [Vagococcus intermedius]WEG74638.1 YitT family protein [Vagococcus intermedius]